MSDPADIDDGMDPLDDALLHALIDVYVPTPPFADSNQRMMRSMAKEILELRELNKAIDDAPAPLHCRECNMRHGFMHTETCWIREGRPLVRPSQCVPEKKT